MYESCPEQVQINDLREGVGAPADRSFQPGGAKDHWDADAELEVCHLLPEIVLADLLAMVAYMYDMSTPNGHTLISNVH